MAASPPTPPGLGQGIELLQEIRDDLTTTNCALAVVVDMLGACQQNHRLPASALRVLLLPLVAAIDQGVNDMDTGLALLRR